MAGLVPQTIRQGAPGDPAEPEIMVEIEEDGPDKPEIDEKGAILEIEHGDGSITVSLDGKTIEEANDNKPTGWFENLADRIGASDLASIADDLLRGIDADIQSRKEWIDARTQGLQLLGLKIEIPGLQGATDGAPVEGMSKVRDPLLLEAVLRFQANARSELLPTDGPVKVRDDQNGSPPSVEGALLQTDQLADALEQDLNHYLTVGAPEYYPDTDRMLFMVGFGGSGFKKVYFCPLRQRPVSESVDADDLIVSNNATDLKNAGRVTHRISMRPSVVRRMQILGVYRDIALGDPKDPEPDSVQLEKKSIEGVDPSADRPEDRNRDLYECYCELDVPGLEHTYKGKASGLEIPYRVTLDVTSREVLSIVRNYEETDQLPEARQTFVKYPYIPGLGFYDIGLLHILGNITNAVTAVTRELLDSGMFANFPGFLIAKQASRQNTSILRVPPGGGQQVDIGGMQDINKAIMPLPYNTQQAAPLMQLAQNIVERGQRLGGAGELQVGEGRADAPVGTTLAMIEQATKIENAVHKRLHAAQAEEFRLLVDVFREHPESFVNRKCPSGTKWTEQVFVKALQDCDLVPQADPNTSSHAQRLMKLMGLKQLQSASPMLYDPKAIDTAIIQGIGFSNPEQFFAPPQAQGQTPPELQEIQAGIKTAQQIADAKTTEANAKMAMVKAKSDELAVKQQEAQAKQNQGPSGLDAVEAQAKMMDAKTRQSALGLKAHEIQADTQNQELDRQAEHHSDIIDLAKEAMRNPQQAMEGAKEVGPIEKEIGS